MLHSYGLDSNPGSEIDDIGSDLEVMDVSILFYLLIVPNVLLDVFSF